MARLSRQLVTAGATTSTCRGKVGRASAVRELRSFQKLLAIHSHAMELPHAWAGAHARALREREGGAEIVASYAAGATAACANRQRAGAGAVVETEFKLVQAYAVAAAICRSTGSMGGAHSPRRHRRHRHREPTSLQRRQRRSSSASACPPRSAPMTPATFRSVAPRRRSGRWRVVRLGKRRRRKIAPDIGPQIPLSSRAIGALHEPMLEDPVDP